MYTSLNHNLMAANTARNLNQHYANLATSTQRLSSGLRINSSADDAAGLAIRELQRADIAALHQGARNANDAISMIQVADGALGIIDEKLIRMKELAEQAATGTYDSTQRLMIDSEFQAMGDEIDRIANATDFNGIKLLDGSRQGKYDGSSLDSTGAIKIHFGTGNDSAEDYYHIEGNDCTLKGLGLAKRKYIPSWLYDSEVDEESRKIDFSLINHLVGSDHASTYGVNGLYGYDAFILPKGLENVTIDLVTYVKFGISAAGVFPSIFTSDGIQVLGWPPDSIRYYEEPKGPGINGSYLWDSSILLDGTKYINLGDNIIEIGKENNLFSPDAQYRISHPIANANETIDVNGSKFFIKERGRNSDHFIIEIDKLESDFILFVGMDSRLFPDETSWSNISLFINANYTEDNDLNIKTQENAQLMLPKIDLAISSKDKIRASLGAMQNRLENTLSNINIQSENLKAAESRISDADISTEMTNFVRNQILTQTSVAMLGQANSMPKMLMQLIQG